MKKFLLVLLTVFSLVAVTPAFADEAKIGVINIQQMLQNLPQMKQISADLKKQFGDRESKIVADQTALKKEAEDFKKNSAVMADKDKQAAAQKIMQEEQVLQQTQAAFQREYMAAQNKSINVLLEQIKGVVDKIANRDKFTLILINTSVAYFDPKLDVTSTVLSELTKK